MKSSRFQPFRSFGTVLAAVVLAAATGQMTASPFTYQGRLVDGGTLANGSYELTFRLFNDATAGAAVGSALVLAPVGVTNGLFTVSLDFGHSVFDGSARWLELAARTNGSVAAPETLLPRQPVNAVPYAIRAFSGSGNAAELTIGTLPDARLSGNIPRVADLNSLSNSLAARLATLEAALNALSNRVPAGLTVVSADPGDAALLGDGWSRFSTVAAPAWVAGPTAEAPSGRTGHAAVWTGQTWMIWGGTVGSGVLSQTGSSYDVASDSWRRISELEAPAARQNHAAVWTGSALVIWGGSGAGGYLGDGKSFSPTTGNWTALPTADAPAARAQMTAVWTGSRLLVWGGRNAVGLLADGKLLNPAGGWVDLPAAGAPQARFGAAGVWTGADFLVWGGQGELGDIGSGARLPLGAGATLGAWAALPTADAPTPRSGHTMIWTGTRAIVWGGKQGGVPVNSGAAYDPVANTWTALPTAGAPVARHGHIAVWTGEEMVVFGGQTGPGASSAVATGGAYNPATGQWRSLGNGGSPLARTQATGVWTGSELLVFGGTAGSAPLGNLQRLNPQPTWYFYRKP